MKRAKFRFQTQPHNLNLNLSAYPNVKPKHLRLLPCTLLVTYFHLFFTTFFLNFEMLVFHLELMSLLVLGIAASPLQSEDELDVPRRGFIAGIRRSSNKGYPTINGTMFDLIFDPRFPVSFLLHILSVRADAILVK